MSSVQTKQDTDSQTIVESWGSLTWLASKELTGSDITVGRVVIKQGRSNPRHRHDTCEEVLYLTRGALDHALDDQVVHLEVGDTLIVPAGVAHNAESVGDCDAEMIVVYSTGSRDFYKV